MLLRLPHAWGSHASPKMPSFNTGTQKPPRFRCVLRHTYGKSGRIENRKISRVAARRFIHCDETTVTFPLEVATRPHSARLLVRAGRCALEAFEGSPGRTCSTNFRWTTPTPPPLPKNPCKLQSTPFVCHRRKVVNILASGLTSSPSSSRGAGFRYEPLDRCVPILPSIRPARLPAPDSTPNRPL